VIIEYKGFYSDCVSLSFSTVYVTAVNLQAANHSQETTINVTIAWPGPAQLTHGIFQGYQIFYRDTRRGQDFNITLRENVSFYEIQHLQPYTEYEISARCLTLEGEGRTSQSIFIWTAPSGNSIFTVIVTGIMWFRHIVCACVNSSCFS